jgi:hypothetical protein
MTDVMAGALAAFQSKQSFRVICHAGTGKTQLMLDIMSAANKGCWLDRTLFLGYNRDLKEETRTRVDNLNLTNIVEVQNYDGIVVKYYDPHAAELDFALSLLRVIDQDTPPVIQLSFERIIIDEAQDMSDGYYKLIRKLVKDNSNQNPQLILVGDPKQTIYEWAGARNQYIMNPVPHWNINPLNLIRMRITRRFGTPICDLVNPNCRGLFTPDQWGEDITSHDSAGTVLVYRITKESDMSQLIQSYGQIATNGCVVLTYSSGEKNQLLWKVLEEAHVSGVPRVVTDESQIGPLMRTIHKSKGKTYEHAIVFLTPGSHWVSRSRYIKRDKPSLLYVALTRARRTLIIVEEADNPVLTTVQNAIYLPDAPPAPPTVKRCRLECKTVDDILRNLSASEKEELYSMQTVSKHPMADMVHTTIESVWWLQAIRMRAEFAKTLNVEEMGPMLDLIRMSEVGQRMHISDYYQRLFENGQHELLYETAQIVQTLGRDPVSWSFPDWKCFASLSKRFHFGHIIPADPEENEDAINSLYMNFMRAIGRRYHVYNQDEIRLILNSVSILPTRDMVVRCANDLLIYVFEAAQTPRLSDIFAAISLGVSLDTQDVKIVYLQDCYFANVNVHVGASDMLRERLVQVRS